jgi:hypothetical protein
MRDLDKELKEKIRKWKAMKRKAKQPEPIEEDTREIYINK